MKKNQFSLIAAVSWFIVSFVLLTLPGTAFPKEDWLDKIWIDKWIHIGLFSILVILWCRSYRSLRANATIEKLKRTFIIVAVIGLGYGIAMEFVQKYCIPYRSFDVGDIVADAVGSFLGAAFSIRRYIKK